MHDLTQSQVFDRLAPARWAIRFATYKLKLFGLVSVDCCHFKPVKLLHSLWTSALRLEPNRKFCCAGGKLVIQQQ